MTLPAGCAAGVWLHAVHRDPAVWVDPDSFDPSRWLITSNAGGQGRSDSIHHLRRRVRTFEGQRACVGQRCSRSVQEVGWRRVRARAMHSPSVGFTVTPANASRVRRQQCHFFMWHSRLGVHHIFLRVVLAGLVRAYEVRLACSQGAGPTTVLADSMPLHL